MPKNPTSGGFISERIAQGATKDQAAATIKLPQYKRLSGIKCLR
jgi:hypothetical protein